MIECGRFELHSIVNGVMRLDGGAMFGTVPRVLWQRQHAPDELHRIRLATRTLAAIDRRGGRVILVDTGTGTKWAADDAARYGVEFNASAIGDKLRGLGVRIEDVTDVIVTHLHFDHNGGVSAWAGEPGGPTRLCYPQARHWIHRDHWRHAHHPTLKDRASFFAHDFAVLEHADVVRWVEGTAASPAPEGIEWFLSQGHTPAQLLPIFAESDGEGGGGVFFTGDVFPTAAHLPAAWVMAYDLHPLVTIEEKLAVLTRCRNAGLRLAFPHDPACAGVRLDPSSEKPVVAETLEL